MMPVAWVGAALGFVAATLPGLVFAAEKKEVIAVESPGLPGAIVCPEPQALEFAIQRQRQRSGFGFSLPPRCMLFGAGTVMTSEGLDWAWPPIVAITTAAGRRITGTTANYMVEQFVRKRPPTAARKAPPPSRPKQWTTALAPSVGKPVQTDAKRTEASRVPAKVSLNTPASGIAIARKLSDSQIPGGDRESKHRRL